MKKELESLQNLAAKQTGTIVEQAKTIRYLEEKIDYLIRQKYGVKSEKLTSNQPSLFDEPTQEEYVAQEDDPQEIVIPVHKRKGKSRSLPDHLPHIRIEHDIDDKDKICSCGCAMRYFKEIISHQYDVEPAQFRIIDNVRFAYTCPKGCGAKPITAPRFNAVLPKAQVTPSLLATIGVQKFEDGLPLVRQAKIYKQRFNVQFSDTTLSNWMIGASKLRLSPLVALMDTYMKQSSYIQADETTFQVLNEEKKKATAKSYLWIRVNKDETKKMVLLHYSSNRASSTVTTLLDGFNGYLQTDGYAGYNIKAKEAGVTHLGYWAHGRRRFADILKSTISDKQSQSLSKEIIALIAKLYKIEKEIKEDPLEIKQQTREDKSKPIIDEIECWLEHNLALANQTGGAIKTAFNYLYRQFPKLCVYLENGKLNIDNNQAENHIRPIAVGRKNWLFATSTKGATALANWYSIIESAKINKLDPFTYLKHIFTELPLYEKENRSLEPLLPWNIVIK